ncbi:DUF1090 domain-containing protein [Pseudomonas sp. BP8]|uniref:DUF1090 domain-containing protein n=1 Tax=Pseudomonas sp. BP8 TaxID=2817864 RepID=UPI001AE9154E|nr:DUF1090 domain-containing protein [Pseudomonas sp. BP8]MBP2260106.1 multidrug efflux pump subunit AcrA (membrane-fusion protein) [Pseudomonas sp. BP8]HDS1737154.1 DUF1090 domain-containing protein [Pseudomonas putida]
MKLFSSLALLSVLGLAAGTLQAAQILSPGLTGCAAKRSAIENQLAQARAQNNSGQIRGLEKALKENTEHCTDEGLKAERQAKIDKAKAEVAERQADLQQAEAKGDADKIATRKNKLAESEAELEQAQAELDK